MNIDLFKTTVYIDNIDSDKLKINNVGFEKTWYSETNSSYNFKNTIDDNSTKYLLNKIATLLKQNISKPFNINLTNIWENSYAESGYQEKHIHAQSHFSFIVYKDVKESNTVFFNPNDKLISAFYNDNFLNRSNFFVQIFEPKCRKNQMILFPSFIEHMVKNNKNNATISGNINIEIME